MTSNDTTGRGAASGFRRGGDTCASHVVLVADSDPAVTDEVADTLGESYPIRTATTGEDLLADLDEAVSVVLVDPTLLATERILDSCAADADCQVAALAADRCAVDERFDGRVDKPVSRSALRTTVDRLCRRVAYHDALDRYFALAQTLATLPEDDPRRDDLGDRLDALETELDEIALPLDSDEIYEVAFRGHSG